MYYTSHVSKPGRADSLGVWAYTYFKLWRTLHFTYDGDERKTFAEVIYAQVKKTINSEGVGWRDRTVDRALALHMTHSGLMPGIAYSLLSISRSDP